MEMLADALDALGTWMLFAGIVLTYYGVLMLLLLCAALALSGAWRWLAAHTWPYLIVAIERRALR